MALSVSCPGCDVAYRLSDEMAGKTVKCQKCSAEFVAHAPEREAVSAGRPASAAAAAEPERGPRKRDWGDPEESRRGPIVKQGAGTGTVVLIVGGIVLAVLVVCGGGIASVAMLFSFHGDEARFQAERAAVVQQQGVKVQRFGVPNALDKVAEAAPTIKVALAANGVFTQPNFLLQNDTMFEGKPFKLYEVALEQGQTYQIDLTAQGQFDAWLRVYGPNNEPIAQDDDSGGNLNSRLVITPNNDGDHKIHVTTCAGNVMPGRGSYTLTIRRQGP